MSSARDLRRITTVGDSVFAVVVTLMAHRVRIPDLHAMKEGEWVPLIPFMTDIGAVVMSFFVASMFWLAYWRVARRMRHADIAFVASSLMFLGTLVLLPISTRIMSSSYMTTTGAAIYSANLFLAALAQAFIRHHAKRLAPEAFRHSHVYRVPLLLMAIFALGGVVAFYHPTWSPIIWACGFVGRFVDRHWGLGPEPVRSRGLVSDR